MSSCFLHVSFYLTHFFSVDIHFLYFPLFKWNKHFLLSRVLS
uniref:Uncharacterized protein n=1 Tax=Arundo donax TaxID=35708 RepID=A0A0A9AG79_ARUDO